MATVFQNLKTRPQNQATRNIYDSVEMITLVIGFMMIIIGAGGLLSPTFLGLQLSLMHCLVLIGTGALAVWSGLLRRSDDKTAFRIVLFLGFFYMANAVLGYLLGDATMNRTGLNVDLIRRFAPGFIELELRDHVMHALFAIWFFADALIRKKKS